MKEELEEETEYEVPIGLQTCMYILATSLVVQWDCESRYQEEWWVSSRQEVLSNSKIVKRKCRLNRANDSDNAQKIEAKNENIINTDKEKN